jgi:hypothetical protein
MMSPKSGSLSASLVLSVVAACIPAGCAAVSTYPPVAGRPVNTPSVSPGPEVMAGAIKEAHRVTAPGTDIVFNLPAGLPENTWNRVAYLLPDSARAMEPGDENVYSVKQLRISGGTAEVDVVYPEGGRSDDGEVGVFHRGVALIVRRTKVPVVPMAVEGPYRVWPSSRRLPRPMGRLSVIVGEPIPAETLLADEDDGVDRMRQTVLALQAKLRAREAKRG